MEHGKLVYKLFARWAKSGALERFHLTFRIIILSAGNVHDSKLAEELLFGMDAKAVLADKGYNSKKIEALIKEINNEVVILSKKNAINPLDYDKHLYKKRHAIECFFQKNKRKPQSCNKI